MEIKGYIYAQWNKYSKDFQYSFMSSEDMEEYGYIRLTPRTIEFESPIEAELKRRAVNALRQKQKGIRADMQHKLDEVEEEIGELLALEDLS